MSKETETLNAAAVAFLAGLENERPVHVHTCSKGHLWPCNSAYCLNKVRDCTEHGGPVPRRDE